MKTRTILACITLVLGAVAVPAMAHDGSEQHNDRHEAADDKADRRANATSDKAAKHNMTPEERHNATDARKDAAMERRDTMRDAIQERKDAFAEAREACKDAFKARNSTENGTAGPGRCISMAAHDKEHKQARAAHYLAHQIRATEHRLDVLQTKEDRVNATIESGDLNETQLADAQAKLDRIDLAQEGLEAKLAALQARLAALQDARAEREGQSDESSDGDSDGDAEEEVEEETDGDDGA